MSIQDVGERIKGYLADERIYLSLLLIAISSTSFILGRASVSDTEGSSQGIALIAASEVAPYTASATPTPLSVSRNEAATVSSETVGGEVAQSATGAYVGSRKGTKYHFPWCAGGKAISEENRIWFRTKAEAEAAGYEPAKNCKGL